MFTSVLFLVDASMRDGGEKLFHFSQKLDFVVAANLGMLNDEIRLFIRL